MVKEEVSGSRQRKRLPEFYTVREADDGKILWRGMTLVHIRDLDEDRRKVVIEEIGRLKDEGLGRNRIQKTIAEKMSVYVPEKVLRKLIAGNGEIDWEKCGPRGRYRDLRLLQELRDRVVRLHMEGKTYQQIQKTVEQEMGVRPSKSQISDWCRNVHRPDGNMK